MASSTIVLDVSFRVEVDLDDYEAAYGTRDAEDAQNYVEQNIEANLAEYGVGAPDSGATVVGDFTVERVR